MTHKELRREIEAQRLVDPSYAHVLLHSLVGIYNHTPYAVRSKRLARYRTAWPELVKQCLKSCAPSRRLTKI